MDTLLANHNELPDLFDDVGSLSNGGLRVLSLGYVLFFNIRIFFGYFLVGP